MQDFYETANPRTVALMLIGVLVLLSAVQVKYLLWPQVSEFRQLHENYTMLDRVVGDKQGIEAQVQRIDREVQALSRQLHGDMAQLPVKQMESFVIGRLQKVSWNTDVELVSVQPGQGEQVQNFRERLFEVKLNARYHDFFEWLQIVNDELGYIVVKKFEIRPAERELQDPTLSLNLTLVSYRIEAQHEAG